MQILLTIILSLFLILQKSTPCFIVHYVLYFKQIPMKYYLEMSQNSTFPYLVHLNQKLNLPDNKTFTREITPGELSDIKKVEVIYHHGGLYIDNDQFIDYQCVKKYVCNLTGLYFLDWTYIKQRWKNSVPLSFIYASHRFNQTLKKSLQGLNQSIQGNEKGPRTVFFSGPSHMQQYRSGMSFVRIPKNCEKHRADRSWIQNKPSNQLQYQKSVQNTILRKYTKQQKQLKLYNKFVQLWESKTVIYPLGFQLSQLKSLDEEFNHVEILDKVLCTVRVIQFSRVKAYREKLENFIKKYQNNSVNFINDINNKISNIATNQTLNPTISTPSSNSSPKQSASPKNHTQINNTLPQIQSHPPDPKNSQIQIPSKKPNLHILLIQIIAQNLYLILTCIIFMIAFLCVYCYRKTRCCHSNNYQLEQNSSQSQRNKDNNKSKKKTNKKTKNKNQKSKIPLQDSSSSSPPTKTDKNTKKTYTFEKQFQIELPSNESQQSCSSDQNSNSNPTSYTFTYQIQYSQQQHQDQDQHQHQNQHQQQQQQYSQQQPHQQQPTQIQYQLPQKLPVRQTNKY